MASLDPSVDLALMLLKQDRPDVAEQVLTRYDAGKGLVRTALVPGFVAALAAELGAGVGRVGPRAVDFVVVDGNGWRGRAAEDRSRRR